MRTSGTKYEPLLAGSPATPIGQVRTEVEASVAFEFDGWGKLQAALASGSQQTNLLATAPGAAPNGSGGTAEPPFALLTASGPPSTATALNVGPAAAAQFTPGTVVAVDIDYTGQTGFVGSGISAAYVRSAAAVASDINYIRRVTLNVGVVESVTDGVLQLATPLPAGTPTAGMQVSRVARLLRSRGRQLLPGVVRALRPRRPAGRPRLLPLSAPAAHAGILGARRAAAAARHRTPGRAAAHPPCRCIPRVACARPQRWRIRRLLPQLSSGASPRRLTFRIPFRRILHASYIVELDLHRLSLCRSAHRRSRAGCHHAGRRHRLSRRRNGCGGTVLISWPAFTAASGDQIPGGNASVNIGSGGALSVRLVPNSGAIPIGSYYTATYHLDDNTVTRQYWVVPQSATPVRLAAIVSTVLPVSVAMQTVTKSYVDSAVAAAAGGQTSSVTGQTPGCVPKAATSTTSTSSFPECDDGTTTTFTHPLTAPQVKAQLPRVDVTAFGADSTCRTDATAGVQAAYTFALAHYASNAMPVIYFPHGCYLISSELRWSADVGITGDGQSATTIKLTNNSANGFTITAPTLLTDDLSYNGFMRDLTIQAANGHNYIADEVELLNAHGYRLYDLQIRGGGGRCINLVTETERVTGTNIYLNKCRLPLVSAGDTDVWRNIHIAAPGQADDGYCYSENCVNGVHPMVNWLTALTPVSAVGSGSTLTVVVQGDTTGGTFNYNPGGLTAGGPGISPLIPGHKFKLAGATGTTCVNGFWIVASVTNNTASDQFTVTATSGINAAGVTIPTSCTGTASLGSATFQPALQPNHHPAVSIRGEEDVFEGGELKSTQYSTAFVHREGALTLKSVYVEGFAYLPTAAQYPTLSSSLEYPGLPQTTTLTGLLPASTAAATTTVADNRWLPYVTSLSDADGAGNFHVMRILPCDYLIGSTATSSCNPSVQRGQYENVYAMGYGTNGMRIVSRNLGGSTAPSGTAWAAGSFLGEIANIGEPFYPVIFENMNAHAINSAGGSNWAPLCIDGTIYTCGEVLIGNVPNELTSFSYGENYANGFIGGQQGAVNIQSGSFVFDPSVGGLIGQAAVKFVGVGGTSYVGGGFFPPFMLPGGLDGTGVTTGNLTAGNSTYAPAEYNAQAPDGSYPSVQWKSEPNDINLSFQDPYGNSTLSKEITKGNDSNLSGTVGRQFANQRCWVDMSNTTGGHAGYRWCASGGPTGTAGLTWDKWNGSAWVSQFGVDGSGNTSAAGNMHVGGTFDSISMAACGHKNLPR